MKHPEDAEDMTKEVLLQVYLNLDKLQGAAETGANPAAAAGRASPAAAFPAPLRTKDILHLRQLPKGAARRRLLLAEGSLGFTP